MIDPSFPLSGDASFESSAPGGLRPPIIVRSAPEAARYLADSQLHFGAIYINPLLTHPGALSLIRMIHQFQSATPIFMLQNSESESEHPFSSSEMNRLAIQGTIPKTDVQEFMKRICRPVVNLGNAPLPPAPSSDETEDKEYLSVPIYRFLFSFRIFFDVYLKVGDKHVKILTAGSNFSDDRFRTYLKKGVSHFYFKRAHYQRCLDYCTLVERTFLTNSGLSNTLKISQTLNSAQTTLQIFRNSRSIQPQHLEDCLTFVHNVQKLLMKLDLAKLEDVQALLANVAAYEHSISTTLVAALLAKPLEMESAQSVEMLGLASFLHDLGLFRMPPSVQTEDPTQMIGEERELFRQHPMVGAQILRDTGEVHPVVVQAVAQHHERRNGSGFPNHLSGQELHRLTEVVAFSEEFARLVQTRQEQSLRKTILEMTESSYEAYSISIIEAFQKAFGMLA